MAETRKTKRAISPIERLMAAMDRCAIAGGEAQWTNGYRAAARPDEQDRLHPKEMAQWKQSDVADRNFRRVAQRLLRQVRHG